MIESKYFKLVIPEDFKSDWDKFVQLVELDEKAIRYKKQKEGDNLKKDKRGNISFILRRLIVKYNQIVIDRLRQQESLHDDQSSNLSKS